MLHEVRGELDGPRPRTRARRCSRRARGWPLDQAHALLAHAALKRRRRDLTGARTLLREARAACWPPARTPARSRTGSSALERTLQLVPAAPAARACDGDLSEREVEILRLLATDLTQREIGAELFVSFNTVKTHSRTVFRKLGVSSRADAVARGRELGLSESPWVIRGGG